jgi:hypothetical protein
LSSPKPSCDGHVEAGNGVSTFGTGSEIMALIAGCSEPEAVNLPDCRGSWVDKPGVEVVEAHAGRAKSAC